ncbi:hypothetical protein [Burkholderia sp. F1]|uniref:hypothetical protein n=1 Tax=Burkholderia sp. F1 TaxID=3366817 RepID=UPI003D72B262
MHTKRGAPNDKSAADGCFDRDPFAARLPFDATILRQDVQRMIAEAFTLLDDDARKVDDEAAG